MVGATLAVALENYLEKLIDDFRTGETAYA